MPGELLVATNLVLAADTLRDEDIARYSSALEAEARRLEAEPLRTPRLRGNEAVGATVRSAARDR